MAKGLERELGLYAIFTLSVGAMAGSGIFVLPGLAFEIAGPAVVLAFVIAGLVALPAALSKAEMATAMPDAGGSYLFVDRAMGPLMGTVAGIGLWAALTFKAAFALAGLAGYLTLLTDLPGKTVALLVGVVLVGLALGGARLAGRARAVLVLGIIATLAAFVVRGSFEVERARLEPFAPDGFGAILTAAAVVFVAYAGLTRIADVADRIENPTRTIPRGMLMTSGVMIALYAATVLVVVGTTEAPVLAETSTPVAAAADSFLNSVGADVISIIAIVALVAVASAGIESASAHPQAMSRNGLAPEALQRIGPGGTPTFSILVTGSVVLALVAFVPLLDLAKLASAFALAVFTFINLAVVAFRQSKIGWYQPGFTAPLYPWIQIAGIAGALVLLTQMGWIPFAGAAGITAFGVLWYRGFGKSRAMKDSALLDALRTRSTGRLVAMTEEAIATGGHAHVLIPVMRGIRRGRMEDLIRFGVLFGQADAVVEVIEFEQDDERARHPSGINERFVERTQELAERMGLEVFVRSVRASDPEETLLEYVDDFGVDLVVSDFPRDVRGSRRFIHEMKDVRDHLPCDSIFLRNRSVGSTENVVIMGSGGPFDVLKISLAARISAAEGSNLRFVHVLPEEARVQQADSIEAYHDRLDALVPGDIESTVSRAADLIEEIARVAGDADLVVMGAPAHRVRVFGDLADRIADRLDVPVMMVHTNKQPRLAWYERVLERLVY